LKQQPIELNEYNDIKHYHQDKMLYQKNDYFYIKSFFWQIMKNYNLYNNSSLQPHQHKFILPYKMAVM